MKKYILFLLTAGCFSKNFETSKNLIIIKGSGQSAESKEDKDDQPNSPNRSDEEGATRSSQRTYNTSFNFEEMQQQFHRETYGEYSVIEGRYRSGDEIRMERELNEVTPLRFQTPFNYSSLNNVRNSSPPQRRSPSPERWSSDNNNSIYNEPSTIPSYASTRSRSPSPKRDEFNISDRSSEEQSFGSYEEEIYAKAEGDDYIHNFSDDSSENSEKKEYKESDRSSEEQSFGSYEEEIYAKAEGDEYIHDLSDNSTENSEKKEKKNYSFSRKNFFSQYNSFDSSIQDVDYFPGGIKNGKYYSAEEVKREREMNNPFGYQIPNNFEEFSLKNNFENETQTNKNSFYDRLEVIDNSITSNQNFEAELKNSVSSFFPTLAVTLPYNYSFESNNNLISGEVINSVGSSSNTLSKISESLSLVSLASTSPASLITLAKEFILFTCSNVLMPAATSIAGVVSGNPELLVAAVAAYDYYTNNQEKIDKVLDDSLDEKSKEKVIAEIKKIEDIKNVKCEKEETFKIDSNFKEEIKKENIAKLNVNNYPETTSEKNLDREDLKNNANSSENNKKFEPFNKQNLFNDISYREVGMSFDNSITSSEDKNTQFQNNVKESKVDNESYEVIEFVFEKEKHINDSKNTSKSHVKYALDIEKIKVGCNLIKITTKDYSFKIFSKDDDIKSLEDFTNYRKNFKIEKVLKAIIDVIDKVQLFDGVVNNMRPASESDTVKVILVGENNATYLVNNHGATKIKILSENFGIEIFIESHTSPTDNTIDTGYFEDVVNAIDQIIGRDRGIKICKRGFTLETNENTWKELENKQNHYFFIYTNENETINCKFPTTGEVKKIKLKKEVSFNGVSIPYLRFDSDSKDSENEENKSENLVNIEYKSDSSGSDSENEEKINSKENKKPKTIEELDKMLIPAVAQLARNVFEKAKEICYQVKDKITFNLANTGKGYKITIPVNDLGKELKNIVIRIMVKGNEYYYRLSFGRKSYTSEGTVSHDPDLTHIKITLNSLEKIAKIIMKIWSEEWKN